jgi:phospholysine phosphohistidine inorganic pyrophosphate phosphatase
VKGILFDLDGVIYQADRVIPGANEVLEWVQSHDIPHLFVTNTTSKPREAICSKLKGMDIQVQPQHILTPPVAAIHWLQYNLEGTVALFVPEATQQEFHEFSLWNGIESETVGAVVIGDLGEAWSFMRLNQAFRCLMKEPAAALIALGMTRYWRAEDGLRLDTGPFVAALQYATGIEPLVMGKPSRAFFNAGAERLGMPAAELLMIGDDIRGDVEGAKKAGLRAALVKTGKFQAQDLRRPLQPDLVLDSVADLPTAWKTL